LCASRWQHDAKRRVVAVAIRRGRRDRRGKSTIWRSRIQNEYYYSSLMAMQDSTDAVVGVSQFRLTHVETDEFMVY